MNEPLVDVRAATWERNGAQIRSVRNAVFFAEQGIPQAIDVDGNDPDCWHVLAFANAGRAIGTGRMQRDGRIGRVAVLKEWRHRGVGRALVQGLIRIAEAKGLPEVHLHSQAQAVPFYAKLGFRRKGTPFLEAGIQHFTMVKLLPQEDRAT